MVENKRIKIALIISIVGIMFLFIGSTYAIFSKTVTSDKMHVIKTGSVKLKLTESTAGISLSNLTTMTDANGLAQNESYNFTIKNIGDTDAKAKVLLIDSGTNTADPKYIKVGLEVNGKETGPMNLYDVERIISETIIKQNVTNTYKLRLWIDNKQEANLENIAYLNISFKLKVAGEQAFFKQLDTSGANAPVLANNMIPVYFDEADNNWKKADELNSDEKYKWYDYDTKMWANAVTVTSTNRSTYLNASEGTTISLDDINAMFVWIPRYKYTYFESSTPVEIPITFESGKEKTGTISCTQAIDALETCTDTTNGNITKGKSTYTHPAFTFESYELKGLWVGKFENFVNSEPEIEIVPYPNSSYSFENIYTSFSRVRNMEIANNEYGFAQSGTTLNQYSGEITGDSNNLDTHLMKNTEWGLVTYLSHSKYGTCKNGVCDRVDPNYEINMPGVGIYEIMGVLSTTGNVYGIYDMNAGSSEYVMGNMQDYNDEFFPQNASTWTSTAKPLAKYYDRYKYDSGVQINDRGLLGDATTEILNWYNVDPYFVSGIDTGPWFLRGGSFNDSNSSIFSFNAWDGSPSASPEINRTRTVLAILYDSSDGTGGSSGNI